MCNCGFILFRFHSSSLLILILVDVHELHRLFHDLVASLSLDIIVVVATSHFPAKSLHMGSVLRTLDTASLIFGLVVGTLTMLVVDKRSLDLVLEVHLRLGMALCIEFDAAMMVFDFVSGMNLLVLLAYYMP